ncbi:hypothetical protein HK100_000310 [Physocladia obscura]|uniref:Uncharacterized protein n=1 Tax=Physocladia obscura TaxID=109957 RepID=A0AAD5TAM5_9FUNG|nr:hypothetical protein HK100_000310 [Physocladia obscura]
MAIGTSEPVDPNAPLEKKPQLFLPSLFFVPFIIEIRVNIVILLNLTVVVHVARKMCHFAIVYVERSGIYDIFEVVKTQMAANRGQSMVASVSTVWSRGGIFGFYQGLIPWAWIEAGTKGAALMFAVSELEYRARVLGASVPVAGILGGMGGGIVQAYTTMVEVTRHKGGSGPSKSTIEVATEIFRREGIAGINKGVNAVAVRQCTNWGSRFGISRVAEDLIRGKDKARKLTDLEKIAASSVGGALSTWNQPIEVIRVEMQSQLKTAGRPEKLTIATAAGWIYKQSGILGFYRGVTPRVCLGMWQTICMVAFGDKVKAYFQKKF